VVVVGDLAVVACGPGGLVVVDPSGSRGPTRVAEVELPRRLPAGRMAAAADRLYVALGRFGVAVLDVSEPRRPVVLYPRERPLRVRMP
jgi:hypothetical protein